MEIASTSAGQFYGAAIAASQPTPTDAPGAQAVAAFGEDAPQSFVQAVGDVARDTIDALVAGEQTTKAMMAGKADAQAVVEALAATEMALEMAVAVRDKVVQAYQEILRMPV